MTVRLRPMLLPLALILLLAISTTFGRFSCPKDLPCYCDEYASDEHKYKIFCSTNSTRDSGFYITIHPEDQVRIRCDNWPDWSQFLQGSAVIVGPVNQFVFTACSPVGPIYSMKVVESQMNAQDVKYLRYEKLRAPERLSAQDLDVFPHVETLVLSSNCFKEFPRDLLRGLPHLKQLNLMNTRMTQIPQGFFGKSLSLEMLDLNINDLKSLTPGVFDGLERLKLLNLRRNKLEELKPGMFRHLQNLATLKINWNKLKTLPVNIFADLKNLETIDLGYNKFTSLPADLFLYNPKLKFVDLSGNYGNFTLPGRLLSNFADLKMISLMCSDILYLPEDLFWGSTSIIELDLSRNHLRTLPVQIFKDAAQLQTLSLSSNDLKDLDARIFSNKKKLVKLDLSYNHLTFIDEHTFAGLESLQELNVGYNDLSHIHVDAFASLKQLKIARFAHNKLTLPISVGQFFRQLSPFYPCSLLEKLDLSHNNITKMYIDWVTSGENLRKLDLSYNNFEYLQASDLQLITINNIEVDLSYNNIRQINLSCIVSNFTNQRYIIPSNSIVILADNPIQYDCDVLDLVSYLNNRMDPLGHGFVKLEILGMYCDDPEHMAGSMLLTDINYTRTFKCLVDESFETQKSHLCASDSICVCSKRPWDNTLLIDCAGRNLTTLPKWIDTLGFDRVELDLSMNELKTGPNMSAKGYNKVINLNLAKNKIATLEENLITPNLKILNIDANNLVSINSEALTRLLSNESNISRLTLHNNPWNCDCLSRDLYYFVRQAFKRYPDLLNISCRNSNVSLLTITIDDLCPSSFNPFLIILCFNFVLLVVAIAALYVKPRSAELPKKINQKNNYVETINKIITEKQINYR